jgi:HflK protein
MVVLLVALAVWGLSGFYTIKDAERGVILRFGQYHGEVGAGIHWKPTFIDSVTPVNTQEVRSLRADGFMLTQDQNLVRVTFEIQYRVFDARSYLFSVVNADNSLQEATDAALRFVIGHSLMDDVLTRGREVVRQNTRQELETIITPYQMGLTLVDVNFRDARPPEEVRDAFDDAIAAQEDQERFVREADAYAREIEPSVSTGGAEPIPAGKYKAMIVKGEWKKNGPGAKDINGKQMSFTFEVCAGEHKGHRIYVNLNLVNASAVAVKIAQAELSAICHATGVMRPQQPAQLLNIPMVIGVVLNKYTKDGKEKVNNKIESYESTEKASASNLQPVAAGAADDPFA